MARANEIHLELMSNTLHGFDKSFGLLYRLNAEQEHECPDYLMDPENIKKYKTCGILHCWATPDGTEKIVNNELFAHENMLPTLLGLQLLGLHPRR